MAKLFFAVSFLFAFLLLLAAPVHSQQLSFRNFTPDDGLPGSEVHGMFQDELGYMWFSTDRGVVRFDGNTFFTFNTTNGLPENAILNFFVQSPHKVWAYGVSHNIYVFDPLATKITFRKHPLSDSLRLVMQSSPLSRAYIRNVYFLEDQSYIITFLTTAGYIHVSSSGEITLHKVGSHTYFTWGQYNMYLGFINRGTQKIPVNYFAPPDSLSTGLHDLIIRSPTGKTHGISTNTYNFRFQFGVVDHFFDGDTVFVALGKYILKVTPDDMTYIELPNESLKLKRWNDQILVATFKGCHALNHNLEQQNLMLPDYSFNNIWVDHEGGLWLSTLEQGIFYHPPQHIKILRAAGYDQTAAIWIEKNNNYLLVAGDKKTVAVFPADLKGNALLLEGISYTGFYQGESPGLQPYLGNLVSYNTERHIYAYITPSSSKKGIVAWSGNSIYVTDKYGPRTFYLETPRINDAVPLSDSTYIIATVAGMYKVWRYADSTWIARLIGNDENVFNSVVFHNNTMLAGSDNAGVYIFKDNRLSRFGIERGLLSNQILDIEPSGDSSFWVATSEGINHVVFGKNGEYTTDMVTVHHGLISNEVSELKVMNDTLWVVGKKGVCFFDQRTIAGKDEMNPDYFYIDSARLNDKPLAIEMGQPLALDYADNLDLYVTQVAFANGRGIQYRYRLSAGENWKWCDGNHVFISGLTHGDFQLEIQAVAGGSNVTSLLIPVTIGKPFWLWPEFYLVLLLILLLIGWAAYGILLKRLQKRRNAEHERVELEIKSIIAQMNPHFTFNTINSIQSYIINHGTRDAVLYLSDFAMLIRKTLDYSRAGYITLKEELEFLQLYTALENKRFKYAFEVNFEINIQCDQEQIRFPSLLIQPVLENAIIHGVSKKKTGEGKIVVSFEEFPSHYMIIVRDNGGGIQKKQGTVGHTSVGMDILRSRLRLYNGNQFQETDFNVTDIAGENTTGAEVRIKLYKADYEGVER